MPYLSDAQRKFMHAKHPKIAKEWDAHTPEGADLPEHVPHNKKAFLEGFVEKCLDLNIDPINLVKTARVSDEQALEAALLMGGLGAGLGGGFTALDKYMGPSPDQKFKIGKRTIKIKGEEAPTWGDVATNALLSGGISGAGTYALNKLGELTKKAFIPLPSPSYISRSMDTSALLKEELESMSKKQRQNVEAIDSARMWRALKGMGIGGLLGAGVGAGIGSQGSDFDTLFGTAAGGVLGSIPGGLYGGFSFDPKNVKEVNPKGQKHWDQYNKYREFLTEQQGSPIGGAIF
jgi:hypothetical protein